MRELPVVPAPRWPGNVANHPGHLGAKAIG
jgi:hypothetical protein